MSYIGRGNDAISNVDKLDNITFSGATTYNLTKDSSAFTPSGANNILISIDGVVQQNNFSVANNTIVFDFSPTSNNTCDWIIHYGVGVVNTPADGTVTTAKVADGAITAAKIADGTVVASEIASNAITTAKINADAVTGAKIADDAIDSEHYVDGSIDLAHMSSESVDEDNLYISNAGSNGQFLQKQSGNNGGLTWATVNTTTAFDDVTAGDAALNITTTSGNITIDAQAGDSDIILKGTDSSSDTTFLTIDGSEAGKATFNAGAVFGGALLPAADDTHDLGSSSYQWRDIYTGDINLNNTKTRDNEVDGTRGSWTIKEGDDNLFILNRLNGKKYKFNLEEIK